MRDSDRLKSRSVNTEYSEPLQNYVFFVSFYLIGADNEKELRCAGNPSLGYESLQSIHCHCVITS